MALVNPKDFSENVFKMFDDSWCLIASYDEKHVPLPYNAMTASWGGMGVLWNKNVFFCFVRPQRYTKEFIDNSEYISLSFFDEEKKMHINFDTLSPKMYQLLEETVKVQLSKSTNNAKEFIERWAYWGEYSEYIAKTQQELGIKPFIKIITNF